MHGRPLFFGPTRTVAGGMSRPAAARRFKVSHSAAIRWTQGHGDRQSRGLGGTTGSDRPFSPLLRREARSAHVHRPDIRRPSLPDRATLPNPAN